MTLIWAFEVLFSSNVQLTKLNLKFSSKVRDFSDFRINADIPKCEERKKAKNNLNPVAYRKIQMWH